MLGAPACFRIEPSVRTCMAVCTSPTALARKVRTLMHEALRGPQHVGASGAAAALERPKVQLYRGGVASVGTMSRKSMLSLVLSPTSARTNRQGRPEEAKSHRLCSVASML